MRGICFLVLSNDGLVLRNEGLHDAPADEVGDSTEGEDYHVGGRLALEAHDREGTTLPLCPGEEDTRAEVDSHRAETTDSSAQTYEGTDGGLGEHIAHGREEVGRPSLVTGTKETDEDGRPPCAISTERLCQQTQYGEAGEDEHGTHTTEIRIHAQTLNKDLRQIATTNREDGNDGIEREDEGDTHGRVGGVAILVGEIGGSPEEEEPPDTVGHELTHDKRPGLLVGETLEEGDSNLFLLVLTVLDGGEIDVLLDIVQLSLVDVLVLARLVVSSDPQGHPYIAQHTDDDERHLPTPGTSQQGNSSRSSEGTDRSTTIEDRGGKGTVLGREIFGGSLDG